MFKKFYLFLILISTMLFTVSCGGTTQSSDPTCNPKCQNWEKCENNKCILQENKCNHNNDCKDDFKCQLDIHECIEDNNQECTNNATKCQNNTLLTCENNVWNSLDCTIDNKICKTNEKTSSCIANETVCSQGETKCDNNNLLTCNNDSWETINCASSNKICETKENISLCAEEEIQELTIPEVKALKQNKMVITSGIVTYINIYDNKVAGFYIQEGQNDNQAIYVFIKDGINSNLKLGDTVKVTGFEWKRFGINRIGDNDNSPSFEIIDSTSTIPNPKEISSTELSVGTIDMLVSITNAPFTVKTLGDAPLYHTILVDNNNNELIINSKLYRFNENGLTVGSIVTKIQGIAGSYQNNDESFTLLVRPRNTEDISFSNEGTKGYSCRTIEPKCNTGLKCNNSNICEIKLPCDNACTETQYCDTDTDACIDLTIQPISEVRTLTEDKLVMVEGVVTQYKRHNTTTANFYLQDNTTANSGIQIYYKNEQAPSISRGDRIRVVALAHVYQGIVELGTPEVQPRITIIENDIAITPKDINSSEINEENLYLFVKLNNPPFTVTSVEYAHPKYVTFEDSLGNSFILNNDWVNDWEYFFEGDVLTSLQGLVNYRLSGQVTFTINPRLESDFTFQEE